MFPIKLDILKIASGNMHQVKERIVSPIEEYAKKIALK